MRWKHWALAVAMTIPMVGSLMAGPADAGLLGGLTDTLTNTVTTVLSPVTNAVVGSTSDAVLYEVTEAVGSRQGGKGKTFKSSSATLGGVAKAGTPLCPASIASENLNGCWVVVRAIGSANDYTGIGPVFGSIEVVVQDKNGTDSPETTVLRGTIYGNMDMSPAFLQGRPVGSISGSFSLRGVSGTAMSGKYVSGGFDGKFRLPFSNGPKALYMRDDASMVDVDHSEYVLGYPAVRLEITI
jgi:hypothetical protein